MIIKTNHSIAKTSWLASYNGNGEASYYYEPESLDELIELCSELYRSNQQFDLVGHTTNTLYIDGYSCENLITTRKLSGFEIYDDFIACQCGVSVRKLALNAVDNGIEGFEGLIDLPGTVAAAIYGHASCYECDISSLLVEAQILTTDGKIQTVTPEWFEFTHRSSALKKGEKKAVILSLKLKCKRGDSGELKKIAEINHTKRITSQPEAKNSLGSIFRDQGRPTFLNYCISLIIKAYTIILRFVKCSDEQIDRRCKHLIFCLLGATDIEPYVKYWNWYQWNDEKSHRLFWKFVRLHKLLFTRSVFEIEIKK